MDGHVVHGWDVDEDGNIWQVSEDADGVRRFAVDGLDEQGNPVYRLEKSASYGVPGPFTKLERVKYIKGSADSWLGGYTTDRPQGKEADFSLVGTEFVHYPNFLKGGNRVAAQRIVLPYDAPRKRYVKAIDIAGGRIVASVLHATRWENSYLFDAASGNLLGRLSPGP